MFYVKSVAEVDFECQNLPILFCDKQFSHYYYFLMKENNAVSKFSAQTKITPEVLETENFVVVGIDQYIGIWNVDNADVAKEINLISNFYSFKTYNKNLFIICEINILVLDMHTLNVSWEETFEEFIEDVDIQKNKAMINFINGVSETIFFD